MDMELLEKSDAARRRRGEWLERLGFGPERVPGREVLARQGVRLWAYGQPGPRPLLLVPAPIKRCYIFDLEPSVSVVRRAAAAGFSVYLIDWELPESHDRELGLADYADRLLGACVAAIERECAGARPALAGHSLGGTFAALYASLNPAVPQALVLLEAPLKFGADSGAFAPMLAALPPVAELLRGADRVPGSVLNLASAAAAPDAFIGERWLDALRSVGNPAAWRRYQRVQRWSLDEAPMSRRLFSDTVELLYRRDAFMQEELRLGGRIARPQAVRAPLLCVVDPRSRVVPERSVLPFHDSVSSSQRRVLQYEGDVGIALQHVGVLVGPSAHAQLWPEILAWLERQFAA
jgi:polyhydroxyalkanoate synthase subunit PhaC